MIYLASPYSHPDKDVRQQRYDWVCEAAAYYFNNGTYVYAPISHAHGIDHWVKNFSWEYWAGFDTKMLYMCDELHVLRLPDWKESVGVKAEIVLARDAKMPVFYVDPTVVIKDY